MASLLPRGFKAKAERISVELRNEMCLKPIDPLCGFELAKHLHIPIYSAAEFFADSREIGELVGTRSKSKGWSALTMQTLKGNTIIIHNHLQSDARQQSNIMHELAHIICGHKMEEDEEKKKLPFFMRDYNKQQEEEAITLGANLQITRPGLLWALKKRMDESEIALHYNASVDMVRFRIRSTGVKKQLGYMGY